MKCHRCQVDKPIHEFYNNATYYCKQCSYLVLKEWIKKNPEKNAANRKRYKQKHKEEIKHYYHTWYTKNKKKLLERRKENNKKIVMLWKKNNPEKIKAHALVTESIRKGIIFRSHTCEHCYTKTYTIAHHLDYTKPLEILWLCDSCHKRQHILDKTEHKM